MKNPPLCLIATIALIVLPGLFACNGNDGLKETAELAQLANESYKQYRTADYPTAKSALLKFISELERRMPTDPVAPGRDMYLGDISISYVRLAKLEEKNNGTEKEKYMKQAVAVCQQKKLTPSCSPEEMRKKIDDFDAMAMK